MDEQTRTRLWAPWRLDYIKDPERAKAPQTGTGCFLCDLAADPAQDAERLVVARRGPAVAVLNRFPYNNGHLLVAPREHRGDLTDLSPEQSAACQSLLSDLCAVLREVLNAQGFNIGLNLGAVAGAGLPGHLHWHLVPRWPGDGNFMTVTANASVIPQSLGTLRDLLRDHPRLGDP
ncbi:HIT family protein [Alienimonas chondri]|uniref:AP-4-A phosphorylase n=1 Tax=Alienimonas chondri TaxID=2681879 RepID=A0ABX1V9I3_9PLAN|nr:HIT domain-containing protein [Alienimonas chondri]NNJ24704.1 AP-4-A phosphorylase [Alienimonas chondri]